MTLSTTLSTAALVLVSSSWACADYAISIDSVERKVAAVAHTTVDRESSNAAFGSFDESTIARKTRPNKHATARASQESSVSRDEFECDLSTSVLGNQLKAKSVSSMRIEFTVEEFSGLEPGDPAASLTLFGRLECSGMSGAVECRGPMSFDGIGYALWHGDVLIGEQLLGPVLSAGASEIASEYFLVPGTYVLEVQCGIVANRATAEPNCNAFIDLTLEGTFEALGGNEQ